MKGFPGFILILFIIHFSTGSVFAGSLDKYGGSQGYKSAPQATKSKRERNIEKAVNNIRQAKHEHRNKLIAEYKRRIKVAEKKKNYKAASFYQEIIDRSGY